MINLSKNHFSLIFDEGRRLLGLKPFLHEALNPLKSTRSARSLTQLKGLVCSLANTLPQTARQLTRQRQRHRLIAWSRDRWNIAYSVACARPFVKMFKGIISLIHWLDRWESYDYEFEKRYNFQCSFPFMSAHCLIRFFPSSPLNLEYFYFHPMWLSLLLHAAVANSFPPYI